MKNHSTTTLTEEWRKYNILAVDDEPRILEEIESDLAFEEFSLFKATSGEEALEILDRQEIYIAICDQIMPGSMTGTQFLAEARKKQPHLIGIMLSAFGDAKYLMSAINDAKAFHYLLKPWTKEELLERINQAFQVCKYNFLKQYRQNKEELKYARTLLDHAVQDLFQTQNELSQTKGALSQSKEALKEITSAIAAISDVTSQLSSRFKQ